MAWLKCKAPIDNVVSPFYLVENNQAVVPYYGGAAQTSSGIQLNRNANTNVYWEVRDVDVTKYKSLTITYAITYSNAMFIRFQINYVNTNSWDFNVTGTFTHVVDLTSMSGNKSLRLFIDNNYGTAYIKSVKLEK